MNIKFNEFRNNYPVFIYDRYEINKKDDFYEIIYYFEIPNLTSFRPKIMIPCTSIKKMDDLSKYIIFNIGMIELISYWKCVCSKKVIVKAGYLSEEQIKWFKKLYFNGLGELFYRNEIETDIDSFMEIECTCFHASVFKTNYSFKGNLIPIGGGKDSCVTLEILRSLKNENSCFMINAKSVMKSCAYKAGYLDDSIHSVERILDKKIVELNNQGFINGHTPFSSVVAFISYLIAYENNMKNIVLSNENSANEETVIGTNINHQYSKTLEFEKDFNYYANKFFKCDIHYFSLLRPLLEYQIAYLFSHYESYHSIFKSCNLGSKSTPWKWCCNCGKCLFIFCILSPFLYKDKLVSIFGENLFEKEELLPMFLELFGYKSSKPFECVGSVYEVRYAISRVIEKEKSDLPFLLKYYKDNYKLEKKNDKILTELVANDNIDPNMFDLLRKEIMLYDPKNNR